MHLFLYFGIIQVDSQVPGQLLTYPGRFDDCKGFRNELFLYS